MPLNDVLPRVLNPVTAVSYRLMSDAAAWRITRSAPVGNVVSLIHLRGVPGEGTIPADLIARFVAGYAINETPVGSASSAFRQVVLADFLATSDRLTTAAVRARNAFNAGLPGLRPGSPAMGKRFEAAYAALHDAWKGMAATWVEGFGRDDVEGLPDWLVTAWEYRGETWDRRAALETLRGSGSTAT